MKLTPELHMLPKLKYHTSGPKIVLRHHFQGDPWIHFCNSYRVYLFLKFMNKVLLKMIAELLQLEAFLFRMTGFFLCRFGVTRAMASSLRRSLDHTQRRTTVGRIPLDE